MRDEVDRPGGLGSRAHAQDPSDDAAASSMVDEARHEAALAHLKEILAAHGTSGEEVDRAVADGLVDLFAADRMLVPAPRRYSRAEVADRTGVTPELLDRFFRALGFPTIAEGEPGFTDLDIQAVQLFGELQDQGRQALGSVDTDTALQMVRILGSSMARVADSEIAAGGRVGDWGDPVIRAEAVAQISDTMIPRMAKLLEYVWRRQLVAAIHRNMVLRSRGLVIGQSPVMAVGFADMVGLHPAQPAFERRGARRGGAPIRGISHDTVAGRRGRVVKMIGDEVDVRRRPRRTGGAIGLEPGRGLCRRRPALRRAGRPGPRPGAGPGRRLLRTRRSTWPPAREHGQPWHRAHLRRVPRRR